MQTDRFPLLCDSPVDFITAPQQQDSMEILCRIFHCHRGEGLAYGVLPTANDITVVDAELVDAESEEKAR
jgi:hypothetical protein